jgi:hypothetical protein
VSSYKEYQEVPAYVQAVWGEDKMVANKDAGLIWASKDGLQPPKVGEKIRVSMNSLGNGEVVGYFSQEGFLGLLVKLSDPPEWYIKQNKGNVVGHIFGPEWKPISKEQSQ